MQVGLGLLGGVVALEVGVLALQKMLRHGSHRRYATAAALLAVAELCGPLLPQLLLMLLLARRERASGGGFARGG